MLYWSILIGLLIIFLSAKRRYRWIYILYKTLPRDIIGTYRSIKLYWRISKWIKHQDTVPKLFGHLVKKHPKKILFYYEDEAWTYEQLNDFSNRIAHYFKSKGYKKGDTVALLLENRPEYVGIWLGLSKIGVVTALINTNLVSDPLIHSVQVAHCRALIYGSDFSKAIQEISNEIKDVERYEFGTNNENLPNSINFNEEISCQPNDSVPDVAGIVPSDKMLYIYTSGTTGLPKAAVISNKRYMYAAVGIYYLADLSPSDIFYNPLPLYHGTGGMLAIGQGLLFGMSVVLRRKFSASSYWDDCRTYNCTVANYVGELCRYLLAVHKPGTKVEHPIKKMLGNGLRPQIWSKFVDTFHIRSVFEFYGSTEGNSNLINIDNKVGAVGFVPRYARALYPLILIRCDEAGEPIRNENGLCTECDLNEPGILIGKINQKRPHSEFAGYVDEKATLKKMLKNVFEVGDLYFNTGDILVQDELGYYYFKDRTGDTFRWKGENVATSEVEAVISNIDNLKDAVVYGVHIPGTEGRAGMAAIVDSDNTLDLAKLAKGLKSKLPSYAVPVFLRVLDSLPLTGTFKLKKTDLQKEAFDFDRIKDRHRLYFYDAKSSEYVPLTKDVYDDIISGRKRL